MSSSKIQEFIQTPSLNLSNSHNLFKNDSKIFINDLSFKNNSLLEGKSDQFKSLYLRSMGRRQNYDDIIPSNMSIKKKPVQVMSQGTFKKVNHKNNFNVHSLKESNNNNASSQKNIISNDIFDLLGSKNEKMLSKRSNEDAGLMNNYLLNSNAVGKLKRIENNTLSISKENESQNYFNNNSKKNPFDNISRNSNFMGFMNKSNKSNHNLFFKNKFENNSFIPLKTSNKSIFNFENNKTPVHNFFDKKCKNQVFINDSVNSQTPIKSKKNIFDRNNIVVNFFHTST